MRGLRRLQADLPSRGNLLRDDLPPEELVHRADNAAFFNETLPGREGPLGAPGGAATVGRVGVDTPLVADLPPRAESPHPSA